MLEGPIFYVGVSVGALSLIAGCRMVLRILRRAGEASRRREDARRAIHIALVPDAATGKPPGCPRDWKNIDAYVGARISK